MSEKKPYFPFYMDLSGKEGLIIGGGRKAYQKIVRMLPYGPNLTVIAPVFLPEIEEIQGIRRVKEAVGHNDKIRELLKDPAFVIVASGSEEEKKAVSEYCKKARIPVNVVDEPELCSFIFPALIAKGDLSIGISTRGASPSVAVFLKEQMSEMIPDRIEEILSWLEKIRPVMKEEIPDERKRARVFRRITETALGRNEILTEDEIEYAKKEAEV